MDEIGQRMGEAAQRMQGKDPGRGYGEQQAALEGLQQFQQQMQQSQQGRGKGAGCRCRWASGRRRRAATGADPQREGGDPGRGRRSRRRKEFRKDLLDAMKQGAPEKYKEQVKRYYEELVK